MKIPLTLIGLSALIVWLAPAEQTLGEGIKVVYLHVALIWAGMTGLLILGVLGLAILLTARPRLAAWAHTLGWVGLGFFLAGIGMSMVAAQVNWGGLFWPEPRNVAMLRVVAVGLIVQIVTGWSIAIRLQGLLYACLALLLTWSVLVTPLVFHPRNPIETSPSLAIQATFFSLFGLCVLLAAWLVVYFQQTPPLGDN